MLAMHRQNLGEMLVAANLIDQVQMQIALAEQRQSGKRFGSTLVDLQFIDENVLAAFLSKQMDVPCISLLHIDVPKKVLRKMHRELAIDCQAIPVRIDDGRLEVAMVDPTDIELIEKLEQAVGITVTPLIAPESSIQAMIDRFYPEEIGDETLTARGAAQQAAGRNVANDPIFWDLVSELESGDLDARLTRIEQNLDRIWTLLERVLRNVETEKR